MRLMTIAMSCIKKSFQSVTTKGVMMNDKAMIIFSTWADKLPENASLILREKLEKLPKEKLSALSFIGLGIVKLLLCWATLGIWALIDLFLVWKGIKQDNLTKIQLNL